MYSVNILSIAVYSSVLGALDDEFFDDPPKKKSFATQLKITKHTDKKVLMFLSDKSSGTKRLGERKREDRKTS